METFAEAREFVQDRAYVSARRTSIAGLDLAAIDGPIKDIIRGFAVLPHCFTLQSCFGHFLCSPGQAPRNLEPIPSGFSGSATYRIAYIALCLANSRRGLALRSSLARIPAIDPDYVQFGSPSWFWKRRPNSYALQVAPGTHTLKDEAILAPAEALRTQAVRGRFFGELRSLLATELRAQNAG